MPVNTLSVATAVTPTVIETWLSHYLNRKPLRQKPTAHISYHEGLEIIRRFLYYASFHTVDELQAFTQQWVPIPHWVHDQVVDISASLQTRSAELIQAQLGPEGIRQVGGKTWWQWRREGTGLKAEWIEMRKDFEERKKTGNIKGQRVMLYVHGGAYYFGSVDEHRYQMQRHARKLKARVLAPKYRLAPQFPFPCGLQDCLAAYLYLLEEKHDPNTIILAGDSAGGGMVLSMLVTLRDQGIPLPAGAMLISPWCDLTHSFPSLGGDGKMDYIPAHGFVHKPSISWPPPNADDLLEIERGSATPQLQAQENGKEAQKEEKKDRVHGFVVLDSSTAPKEEEIIYESEDGKYSVGPKGLLSLQLNGKRIQIKDQIQMYAPNHMLTHPLVSPALQPSLGGLPPITIQTGGAELLHDEQVYIAHKAAQPLAYLPPPSNHQTAEAIEAQAARYRPTNVQLQVWDDLCHVTPTLSFTRPAKHMYRSIAQFGAWALARAQKTTIDILDDDNISIVSSDSSTSSDSDDNDPKVDDIKLSMPHGAQHVPFESIGTKSNGGSKVGRAGDPLPPFVNHMIRQRVDRHGNIYPLAPKEHLVALNLPRTDIGVPKSGPVNKWMKAQQQWNGKFAKQKLKIQKQRIKDMQKGYDSFVGEIPPPTALAGRRVKGMKHEKRTKKSWAMAMWSGWGSKHDQMTIDREEKADASPSQPTPETTTVEPSSAPADGTADARPPKPHRKSGLAAPTEATRSRSRSRHSTVTDRGQINASVEDLAPIPGFAEATKIAPERKASPLPSPVSEVGLPATPGFTVEDWSRPQSPLSMTSVDGRLIGSDARTLIPDTDTLTTRPTRGGVAYPFSLKVEGEGRQANASMLTLQSVNVNTGEERGNDVVPMLPSPLENEEMNLESAELAALSNEEESVVPAALSDEEKSERPNMERFVTADTGGLLNGMSGVSKSEGETEKTTERPGVERFETAMEDLSTLANGHKA